MVGVVGMVLWLVLVGVEYAKSVVWCASVDMAGEVVGFDLVVFGFCEAKTSHLMVSVL